MPTPDPMRAGLALLNVHPGSQVLLMEAMKDQIKQRSTMFSQRNADSAMPGYPYTTEGRPSTSAKPDLGAPVPIVLKSGDAFLCTAKMAITFGLLSTSPASATADPYGINSLVFFRLTHMDHLGGLREISLENVWCEYRLAESILNSNTEVKGHAGTKSAAVEKVCAADDHSELLDVFTAAQNLNMTATGATISSTPDDGFVIPQPAPIGVPGSSSIPTAESYPFESATAISSQSGIPPLPPPPCQEERSQHDLNNTALL